MTSDFPHGRKVITSQVLCRSTELFTSASKYLTMLLPWGFGRFREENLELSTMLPTTWTLTGIETAAFVAAMLGLARNKTPRYQLAMREPTKFRCSNCETEYKVVRVEAPATHKDPLLCLSCRAPLQNRDGK